MIPDRCLTVKNPWALLLVRGFKDIENRKWRTSFTGPLFIHASKVPIPKEEAFVIMSSLVQSGLIDKESAKTILKDTYSGEYNNAIIGAVNLVECLHPCSLSVAKFPSWRESGCYGFVMKNPIGFKHPIKGVKGFFNLWKVNFEVPLDVEEILQSLR